jgi:Tfp pilus assembly protein PilX
MKFLSSCQGQRGTVLIIVMVLLAVMAVFALSATQSVTLVKRELKLIEKKQLQHYQTTSGIRENK